MTNEELQKEMIAAMKAKDKVRLSIIRQVKAEVKNIEVNERRDMTEEDVNSMIKRLIKQTSETLEMSIKAGTDQERTDNLTEQVKILESLLPAQAVPAASASASGESAELIGPYAPLMKAVEKGLKGDAAAQTKALLAEKQPLEVVDEALIPALDIVGAKYEKGTLFLPQLLQAASAAQSAFEEIKNVIAQKGEGSASKGRIVLATVKGDVHDIGKNIVKVILENYGFEVIDLGRDVPVETVVNTVREKNVHLVGLSALMTTTLKSMEETIAALHEAGLDCKIMVGGAVLTPEYAEKIGADWYAKDAKRSADIAKEFFGAQ